jgi:hypothetical protein
LDAANQKSFTSNELEVEYLIVAGGGGGGTSQAEHRAAGGGAGGVLLGKTTITPQSYSVVVGSGGNGAAGPVTRITGGNGGNSSVFSQTSIGGGGGSGGTGSGGANSGGSGGGGHYNGGTTGGAGTTGQGFKGGNSVQSVGGAGGGGASEEGYSNATGPKKQFGGDGIYINWINEIGLGDNGYFSGGGGSGENPSYSGQGGLGGGGAGATTNTNNGSSAIVNTGGGGGGSRNGSGGNGGSGIVIIRYRGPQKAKGGTVTQSNGWTIHTFTGSGNFEVGQFWGDLSLNENSGELVNGPTFDSGNGGSLSFDGVDDKVILELPTDTNSATFMIWCKTNSSSGSQIVFGYGNGTNQRLYLGFTNSNWDLGISSNAWTSTGILTDLLWTHFSVVLNNGTAVLYKNGINVRTRLYDSYSTVNNTLTISTNNQSNFWWNGDVSLFQVYNRALSAEEILQNYNATKGRFGL